MQSKVDTLITVSNDRLLEIVPESFPLTDAFLVADEALRDGVVGISDIIVKPGLINVDFADVRAVMSNAGTALMGTGWGTLAGRHTGLGRDPGLASHSACRVQTRLQGNPYPYPSASVCPVAPCVP